MDSQWCEVCVWTSPAARRASVPPPWTRCPAPSPSRCSGCCAVQRSAGSTGRTRPVRTGTRPRGLWAPCPPGCRRSWGNNSYKSGLRKKQKRLVGNVDLQPETRLHAANKVVKVIILVLLVPLPPDVRIEEPGHTSEWQYKFVLVSSFHIPLYLRKGQTTSGGSVWTQHGVCTGQCKAENALEVIGFERSDVDRATISHKRCWAKMVAGSAKASILAESATKYDQLPPHPRLNMQVAFRTRWLKGLLVRKIVAP